MNIVISAGMVLDSFEIAIITPIYKGNPNGVENYRPTSILTTFAKIFESVIKIRLAYYFEENQLFPTTQFGFNKCTTAHAVTSFNTYDFTYSGF